MAVNNHILEELSMEITYRCPFKCIMCSSDASIANGKPEIPFEKIKELIEDTKQFGTTDVSLSGGEPSFHPNFIEIVRFIKENGMKPIIYTIGVGFDKENKVPESYSNELISLFKEVDAKVILPIHGIGEIHDRITQMSGSFEIEIETIKKLIKNGIEVQIHFVPQPYNYKDVVNVYKLCNELKVNKMSILRFVQQGRGEEHSDLNDFQLGSVMGMLYTIRKLCSDLFITKLRIGIPMDFTFLYDGEPKIKSCDGGKSKILVRANGEVNVCPAWKCLDEFIAGDINSQTLEEIWNESKIYKTFREFDDSKLEGDCKSCNYVKSCVGGCAAQRIIHNGDIKNGKDHYCFIDLM